VPAVRLASVHSIFVHIYSVRFPPSVLQPWGRIVGKLTLASRPAASQRVVAVNQVLRYTDAGRRFSFLAFRSETSTDAEGTFRFDKVPPGKCNLFVEQQLSGSSFSSHDISVDVTAGDVTQALLGGTGRSIVGKALLPDTLGPIDWSKVSVRLHSKTGELGSRPNRDDFQSVQEFIAVDERFHQAAQAQRRFGAACDGDGSFRGADVPAGAYELRIEIHDPKPDSVAPRDHWEPVAVIASLVREVVVPEDQSAESLDLGTLQLLPSRDNASAK